jgi:hypothetical protein
MCKHRAVFSLSSPNGGPTRRELRRRLTAALDRRVANSSSFERRLTWMFGSPRTGSTWLMKLLAEHPSVSAINEPLIGLYLSPFLSDFPGGDATLLDSSNYSLRQAQRDKPSQFFSEVYSHIWIPGLARLIRERLQAEAARSQPRGALSRRLVLIKEPNGSQSADVIMRATPQSRLLFLLRDGRDVVDSELAANLEGSWVSRDFPGLRGIAESDRLAFVVQSAHKWLWRTEAVQRALEGHQGPSLVVRYEQLLEDPAAELRRVFSWLSLVVSEADLRHWTHANDFERMASGSTGPKEFFRSAQPGAWRDNLRSDEVEAISTILGPKLHELGYE